MVSGRGGLLYGVSRVARRTQYILSQYRYSESKIIVRRMPPVLFVVTPACAFSSAKPVVAAPRKQAFPLALSVSEQGARDLRRFPRKIRKFYSPIEKFYFLTENTGFPRLGIFHFINEKSQTCIKNRISKHQTMEIERNISRVLFVYYCSRL